MTITLTQKEIEANKSAIDACVRGAMCKIIRIEHILTGETEHIIHPDATSGWHFDPTAYHGTCVDGSWRKTGLGTFYLVRKTNTAAGCILEFTDDLNPDLP